MKTPVTREDFVMLGKCYTSQEIVDQADRMIPLASEDLAVLTERGYGQAKLEELKALRAKLSSEMACKREARGQKIGARLSEAAAKKAARFVLRSGVALARVALASRKAPEGETEEQTCEVVGKTTGVIDAISGTRGQESATLRSAVEALRSLLTRPDLAAPAEEAQAREKFLAKIDSVHAKLVEISTDKKACQEHSKASTLSTKEMDGRAYANMRLLSQVGRAAFRELNDLHHAKSYQLTQLHAKPVSQDKAPVAEPAGTAPNAPESTGSAPTSTPTVALTVSAVPNSV